MKWCNLCGFPIVRINKGAFGDRCVRCLSTFIHRAVGLLLEEMKLKEDICVYELSSKGALFKYLKKTYKNFSYSEYYDDVPPGLYKNKVQCQDVQNLTYPEESFDLVTSTEVFEHVPDDLKGFLEVHRVLKKNGHFVFTVPLSDQETTIERAQMRDGRVVHILPPVYHCDRIRGRRKVLAFRDYGLDIIKRLRSAGFDAIIREFNSVQYSVNHAKVILCTKNE